MERIGLIDIGSNTIRLVIFEFDKKTGLNELLNIKTPYLKKKKHFMVFMPLLIPQTSKMVFLSTSVVVLQKLHFLKTKS